MPVFTTYRSLPPIQTGYPLDDVWSVVVPIARTNEVLNPSFETNTTGYTAGSGSLARSTAKQYHGAYSGAYTPTAAVNDGFFYGTITTTAGQIRAIHCKFWGAAGVPYALTLATTGGVDLVVKPFVATGRWQWIILYYTETSSTTRRMYFRKNNSASVAVFYVDGVNSEVIQAGEIASTHIDGDQLGLVPNQNPPAYLWNGTPHASTSTRSGLTRAGGMVIPFKKFGFILTAMIGLGLALPQNVASEYARLDGGYDDYTRKPSRQFTLTGRFQGRTYAELRRNRSGLSQLFDRDLIAQDQRLTLLRRVEDGYGRVLTSDIRVLAKYQGGLDGNTDNMAAESVPITFTQYLPVMLSDGESGAALGVQTSVTNANAILQRSPAGVWSAMAAGISGATPFNVLDIAIGQNGIVYACGSFNGVNSVANTIGIAQWNPATSTWSALGTGSGAIADSVASLSIAPNGDLIVVGTFTTMGGVANTTNIARWNGSAWSSITPLGAANSDIFSSTYDGLGNLYVAGAFTSINGVAATRIAKYDGTTWTALSTGLNGIGYTLVTDAFNNVYVGGSFTTPFTRIAKWNGSVFSALGSGMDATVESLAIDPAGNLYAGGDFTLSGTTALARLGRWNGTAWFPLGSGMSQVSDIVYQLTWDNGLLYIGGNFFNAGGLTLPDALVIWNGAAFVFPDVDLPGNSIVQAIAFGADKTMYIGFSQVGTAISGSTTTITNVSTARSYPVIRLTGPTSGAAARIWSIANVTTGRAIYFNYLMNVGEIATLTLQPDALSFVSNTQGAIMGKILPGSNVADFFLQPGANTITFLSASTTVTATLYYRPAYLSLDDVP